MCDVSISCLHRSSSAHHLGEDCPEHLEGKSESNESQHYFDWDMATGSRQQMPGQSIVSQLLLENSVAQTGLSKLRQYGLSVAGAYCKQFCVDWSYAILHILDCMTASNRIAAFVQIRLQISSVLLLTFPGCYKGCTAMSTIRIAQPWASTCQIRTATNNTCSTIRRLILITLTLRWTCAGIPPAPSLASNCILRPPAPAQCMNNWLPAYWNLSGTMCGEIQLHLSSVEGAQMVTFFMLWDAQCS